SWQARYDYNFAGLGIPGLTFMTRYVKGTGIDQLTTSEDGHEWERDTDIAYVFQEGPVKGLGIKWRNATTRSNYAQNSTSSNSVDENRLIVSYTMPLW
ncbi:OprD family outer membrane porin, partial [Pseudomonas panipatensis]